MDVFKTFLFTMFKTSYNSLEKNILLAFLFLFLDFGIFYNNRNLKFYVVYFWFRRLKFM